MHSLFIKFGNEILYKLQEVFQFRFPPILQKNSCEGKELPFPAHAFQRKNNNQRARLTKRYHPCQNPPKLFPPVVVKHSQIDFMPKIRLGCR